MTVIVLMGEASKPSTWKWLFSDSVGGDSAVSADGSRLGEDANIDTRVPVTQQPPQPPGVVFIDRTERPQDDSPGSRDATSPNSTSPLGIDLDRYASIVDDTVFRSQESQLWFESLAALRDTRVDMQAPADFEKVGFTQLFRQPDQYRGHLIEAQGTVRRAHQIVAHANEYGIESYWRCWLFPDGTTNPIVVYAMDMPPSFPTGMAIREDVTFRGVFFKRWVYQARGGGMVAPLVLARTGQWQRSPAPASRFTPSIVTILTAVVVAALLAALVAVRTYRGSLRTESRTAKYRETTGATKNMQQLQAEDILHPSEIARAELSGLERRGTPPPEIP